MKTNPLKTAWDKSVRASQKRQIIRGLIGAKSTDTPAQCVVSGRPTYLHVRVGGGDTYSPGIARNQGNVVVRANTPIEMILDGGVLIIQGHDTSERFAAATGGDTLNQFAVPRHNHKIGSGLEYEVESLRLEPGRVHADSHSMVATVNGFRHGGGTFSTATVDLTSYIPAAGYHRWVLVGVDPASNAIVTAGSTPVILATTLAIADIDGIGFDGYIPLGAYQVADTTTELASYAYEAREWFTDNGAAAVDDIIVFDDEFVFFDDEVVTA